MIRLFPPWCTGAVLQYGEPHSLNGSAAAGPVLRAMLQCPEQQIALRFQIDAHGNFSAVVPAMPPSGPWTLTLYADDTPTLICTDLWFGQLLLFAGQSNVGWPLACYPDQLASAQQRLSMQTASTAVRCYRADPDDFRAAGQWLSLNARHCPFWPALLYHVSQCDVAPEHNNMMLGLVDLSWPGSAINAWTPAPDGPTSEKPWQAGALFTARLAPWLCQPFHSLIWYQGEQDAMGRAASQYAEKLQAWLRRCRQYAGHDFPLLLVQIAGFGATGRPDPANGFVQVRQAQQHVAATTPGCALVCAADLGATDDIHPPLKAELARRLALTLSTITAQTPLLQAELHHADNKVYLQLPALTAGEHWQIQSADGTVQGFCCNTDTQHWLPVDAQLSADRQQLLLNLPAKAQLLGYGIAAMPALSLYTSQGLPLLPQIWPLSDAVPGTY